MAAKVLQFKKDRLYLLSIYSSATWNTRDDGIVDITEINNGIFGGSQIPLRNGNVE